MGRSRARSALLLAAATVLAAGACSSTAQTRDSAVGRSHAAAVPAALADCAKPGAYCLDADFSGVDLTAADFTNARLPGAKFDGANLRSANLSDAWLPGSSWGPAACDLPMAVACTQDWGYDTLAAPLAVKSLAPFGSSGGFSGDGASARQALYSHPSAVAFSADSKTLYVGDAGNHRVRAVDLTTGVVQTIAGTGQECKSYSADRCGDSDDPGSATSRATFGKISGLALDTSNNRLLVADSETHVIRVINLADSSAATLAGTGRPGLPEDGAQAGDSPLGLPRGMAVSGSHAFVADSGNNAVYDIDLDSTAISRIAGAPDGRACPGLQTGSCVMDGDASEALLSGPRDVAVGPDHALYVADTLDHAVRRLTPANQDDFQQAKISIVLFSPRKSEKDQPGPSFVGVNQHGLLIAGPADPAGTSLARMSAAQVAKSQQASWFGGSGVEWEYVERLPGGVMGAEGAGAVAPNGRYLAATESADNRFLILNAQTGPNVQSANLAGARLGYDPYGLRGTRLEGFIQHDDTVIENNDFSKATIARSRLSKVGGSSSFIGATVDDSELGEFDKVDFRRASWGSITPDGTLSVTGSCMAGLRLREQSYSGWKISDSNLTGLHSGSDFEVAIVKPEITNVNLADSEPGSRWKLSEGALTTVNFAGPKDLHGNFKVWNSSRISDVAMDSPENPSYTKSPENWGKIGPTVDGTCKELPNPDLLVANASIDASWTGENFAAPVDFAANLVTDVYGQVSNGTISQTRPWGPPGGDPAIPVHFTYKLKFGDAGTVVASGSLPSVPEFPAGGPAPTVTTQILWDFVAPLPFVHMGEKVVLELSGPDLKDGYAQQPIARSEFQPPGPPITGEATIKGVSLKYPIGARDYLEIPVSIKANSFGYIMEIRANIVIPGRDQDPRVIDVANRAFVLTLRNPATGVSVTRSPALSPWDPREAAAALGLLKAGQTLTVEATPNEQYTKDKKPSARGGQATMALHN